MGLSSQGAAKGGRQRELDHFFSFLWPLLVAFSDASSSLFSSPFCQTPFAGLLLRQAISGVFRRTR